MSFYSTAWESVTCSHQSWSFNLIPRSWEANRKASKNVNADRFRPGPYCIYGNHNSHDLCEWIHGDDAKACVQDPWKIENYTLTLRHPTKKKLVRPRWRRSNNTWVYLHYFISRTIAWFNDPTGPQGRMPPSRSHNIHIHTDGDDWLATYVVEDLGKNWEVYL